MSIFKARLARFYGWSSEQIDNMTYDEAIEYFQCIEHLQAEEHIYNMQACDYPHLVGKDRSKIFQKHKSMLYNDKVYTSEELEDFFKVKGLM